MDDLKESLSLYDKILKASEIISRKARSTGSCIIVSSQVFNSFKNIDVNFRRKDKINKLWE